MNTLYRHNTSSIGSGPSPKLLNTPSTTTLVIHPGNIKEICIRDLSRPERLVYQYLGDSRDGAPLGQPCTLKLHELRGVSLYVPSPLHSAQISNCALCEVFLGPVHESLQVSTCSKSNIYSTAKEVHIADSSNLNLLLYTVHPINFLNSRHIRIGNYCFFYQNQDDHIRQMAHFFKKDSLSSLTPFSEHLLLPNNALTAATFSTASSHSHKIRFLTLEEEDMLNASFDPSVHADQSAEPSKEPENLVENPPAENTSKRKLFLTASDLVPISNVITRAIPRLKNFIVTPSSVAEPGDIVTLEFAFLNSFEPREWDWIGLYPYNQQEDQSKQYLFQSTTAGRVQYAWVHAEASHIHMQIPKNTAPGFYEFRYYQTNSPLRAIQSSKCFWIGPRVEFDTLKITPEGKIECFFTQLPGRRLPSSAWVGLYFEDSPQKSFLQCVYPTYKHYASSTSNGRGEATFDSPTIAEITSKPASFVVRCRIFVSGYNEVASSLPLRLTPTCGISLLPKQDDPKSLKLSVSCSKAATKNAHVAVFHCDHLDRSEMTSKNRFLWSNIKHCIETIELERKSFGRDHFVIAVLYLDKKEEEEKSILILHRNANTGYIEEYVGEEWRNSSSDAGQKRSSFQEE